MKYEQLKKTLFSSIMLYKNDVLTLSFGNLNVNTFQIRD
jgi:hypothetical protein